MAKQPTALGELGQRCPEASTTQLSSARGDLEVLCACESGVALRLPPQSKIAVDFWIAVAEMPGGIGDTAFERAWRLGSFVRVRKRCRAPLATAVQNSPGLLDCCGRDARRH
jgi:hypothetical protein